MPDDLNSDANCHCAGQGTAPGGRNGCAVAGRNPESGSHRDPTTRQELERKSDLGRAVVADRLTMLADLGLIDESELGTATGGRAPRLVRLAARRGRVLVATLDQTALGVGVADLAGNLLTEHHEEFELTAPPVMLADRLTDAVALVAGPAEPRPPGSGASRCQCPARFPAPMATS